MTYHNHDGGADLPNQEIIRELYRYSFKVFKNNGVQWRKEVAEDLIQDVIMIAIRKGDQINQIADKQERLQFLKGIMSRHFLYLRRNGGRYKLGEDHEYWSHLLSEKKEKRTPESIALYQEVIAFFRSQHYGEAYLEYKLDGSSINHLAREYGVTYEKMQKRLNRLKILIFKKFA